jgi:hypothetical protein
VTQVAIYSALYGGYEYIKPLPDLGVLAVMLTDEEEPEAPGWLVEGGFTVDQFWPECQEELTLAMWNDPAATGSMMCHKYWKMHPEEAVTADVSIWLDASIEVTEPNFVDLCLEALGEDDWCAVPHPWRNCIYDEAAFSALLPRYDAECLNRQSSHYRGIGHPPHWGLFATGVMVRRHSPAALEVSDLWWDECVNWSHQDQVSLPVLFRLKEELKWNTNMPWSQWWVSHPHGR